MYFNAYDITSIAGLTVPFVATRFVFNDTLCKKMHDERQCPTRGAIYHLTLVQCCHALRQKMHSYEYDVNIAVIGV